MTVEPDLLFPATQFDGEVARDGKNVSVRFSVRIDKAGDLYLEFDPIAPNRHAFSFVHDGNSSRVSPVTLSGVAATGEIFYSDSFYLVKWSHGSDDKQSYLRYGGNCSRAKVTFNTPSGQQCSILARRFRRLRTLHILQQTTDIGVIRLGSAEPDAYEPQALTGLLQIKTDGAADSQWWAAASERLSHIARVMSFATDIYLQTYIEHRISPDLNSIEIFRRGDAPDAFLPPFHFLNLNPIFQHACLQDIDSRARFVLMDAAIKWLVAPAYYDEMKLMSAMTSLENMIGMPHESGGQFFLKGARFKKLASSIRKVLSEWGAPAEIFQKIPELNRLTFSQKLGRYICEHKISTANIESQNIDQMVSVRNMIVHRGIYLPSEEGDARVWDHLMVARELATRFLLHSLQFRGNYFSPMEPQMQFRFPSGQRLTDDAMREIPEVPSD